MYIHLKNEGSKGTAFVTSAYWNQMLNGKHHKVELKTRGSGWGSRTLIRKIYLAHKEIIFYVEPGGSESKMSYIVVKLIQR